MRRPACLLILVLLTLAAPAQASKLTYGSDLSGTANLDRAHPRDWAAWTTAVANPAGDGYVAPAQGEVAMVQLKGTILKPDNDAAYNGKYPAFGVHIVVLRPQGDGTLKLVVATEELPFPFGGNDQQITTYNLQDYDARMCVLPGDIVAFDTNGGFGSTEARYGGFPDDAFGQGYHVKMFSRISTSEIGVFEETPSGTFQVGDDVSSSKVQGQELLMRTTIGTAADARYFCRTKSEQSQNLPAPSATPTPAPTSSLAAVPTTTKKLKGKAGKVTVPLACAGPAACAGTLALRSRARAIGSKAFSLTAGQASSVKVKLSGLARGQLKRQGSLPVKALVTTPAGATAQKFTVKKA